MGVLDDALAHPQRQIQPAKAGIALLEPGDDAQRVQIMVEAQAICRAGTGRGPFRRRGQRADGRCRAPAPAPRPAPHSAPARGCHGAGNLRHFQRMGQAAAKVVRRRIAGQAA